MLRIPPPRCVEGGLSKMCRRLFLKVCLCMCVCGSLCRCSGQRAASSKQRAANSEQRAANKEQRAANSEQRAASSEQRAANSEQRTASSELRTTSSEQQAANSEQRAANSEQRAANSEQRAAISEQRAANNNKSMRKSQKRANSTIVADTSPSFWFSLHFWEPWCPKVRGVPSMSRLILLSLLCVLDICESALRRVGALLALCLALRRQHTFHEK